VARFKAFIEGSSADGAVGGVSLHKRASECIVGVNGKRAGIEVEASVEESDDSDQFRLYATRGNLAATRLFLGTVRLERGMLTFQKGAVQAVRSEKEPD
jgi:hypothetical protein